MSTLNASPGLATPAPSAPASGSPQPQPVSYGRAPRRQKPRINLRLVALLALVAAPFIYFGYVILDQSLNGGVTRHGDYYDVDLKSLGYFPFDAAKDGLAEVPSRWRQLDGKRVALQGEMYDPDSAGDKINSFQLVYSIQKCCFGGPPRVQERVFAAVPDNGTVHYYGHVGRVRGTRHVTAPPNECGQIDPRHQPDA